MFGIYPQLLAPEHRGLLKAANAIDDFTDPSAIARLRKLASAELVKGAIDLTTARRKAAMKFPHADRMIATPTAIEQASSIDVATHKARRFARLGVERIADLCCGIGGDAAGLADVVRGARGAEVWLFDANPSRVWMARHNVETLTGRRCPAVAADVTTLKLNGAAFHLDPDRRVGSRRLLRYEDYLPGPDFIDELIQRGGDGAVKLSPGVDLDSLPDGEVEIINRGGTLAQAVLWVGRLAQHRRTATLLQGGTDAPDSEPLAILSGSPVPIPVREPGRYLLAVDPAVERAGLIGVLCEQLNIASVHPSLGLLTADEPTPSPWLTPFELIEAMPWRPRRVKAWLHAHGGGVVEVKTRGGAIDPNAVQKQLRGGGDQTFTIFVLRYERKILTWITRRV